MPTTTVIDTIHHVIYDTVYTVSFDTVRTFDTVKVQLDSNYSVQILHDAQQFYADSFNSLLAVIGFAFTFASILFAVISTLKTNSDSRKLKNDFDATSSKVALDAAKEIATKTKQNFEKAVEEQQTKLDAIKSESNKILKTRVFSRYAFLVRLNRPVSVFSELSSLLNEIDSAIDNELLAFAVSSILPELEKNFEQIEFGEGYDRLVMWVEEDINRFSSSIETKNLNESDKSKAVEYISKIDSKIRQKLDEFYKVKSGEFSPRSGRFYTSQGNKPDPKHRKK